MDFPDEIWFIPAIKRLTIKGIGVWKDVSFEFSNGLNIITGQNATGKTTILNAIRSAFAMDLTPKYLQGQAASSIELQLRNDAIQFEPQAKPWYDDETYRFLSAGERAYNILSQALQALPDEYCLIMDCFPLDYMQEEIYAQALDRLQNSSGQKIVTTLRKPDISTARIFECIFDLSSQTASVVMQME